MATRENISKANKARIEFVDALFQVHYFHCHSHVYLWGINTGGVESKNVNPLESWVDFVLSQTFLRAPLNCILLYSCTYTTFKNYFCKYIQLLLNFTSHPFYTKFFVFKMYVVLCIFCIMCHISKCIYMNEIVANKQWYWSLILTSE